jgi:peptide chain release factor 2
LDELNAVSEDPRLWDNPTRAQAILRERTRLEQGIASYRSLARDLKDAVELIELGEAEGDQTMVEESVLFLVELRDRAVKAQLESLLAGEADANDCYLEVNAGAGGTEAQDWAGILMRMYIRWAGAHSYEADWLEENPGEAAGIKSATVAIKGRNAYGWLKSESGVHRLVRISPFDSHARRHTSFASVAVSPVIDDSIEITIDEKDLEIDTFRSSGAGGQHVNKTDSAVRITHIPTGIIIKCQSDRSQHRNRAQAMAMLRAKLYQAELQKREEAASALEATKTDIGWGHQIRSYVLQPYQMVKDLRTGVEQSDVKTVLDGKLDPYLEASLAAKLKTSGGVLYANEWLMG